MSVDFKFKAGEAIRGKGRFSGHRGRIISRKSGNGKAWSYTIFWTEKPGMSPDEIRLKQFVEYGAKVIEEFYEKEI